MKQKKRKQKMAQIEIKWIFTNLHFQLVIFLKK
jgi:hypothetical protein